MKNKWLVLSTGFALFSMFFGSGNLVFPIAVGQESQGHTWLASLGILLTGVIVPFLGVLGMLLYQGNISQFFSCFGRKGTFWFSLLALSLMGPFGVLARCLTVAHGALQLIFPSLSLMLVSAALCGVIFGLTVNKNKIISILGTFLTPFLLLSMAAIALFGFMRGSPTTAIDSQGFEAFKNGFLQGYQTMDLLAAFFFSTFIINHLEKAQLNSAGELSLIAVFLKASAVGAGLLSIVYCLFVLLGWTYAPLLENCPPQEMLGRVALEALGPLAAPCICVAVVLACLTTALVLASLFADFLRKDISNDQINHRFALLITLGISFLVSTLDFAGIAQFLGPILEIVYPALIVLTLINILHRLWGVKHSHWPVTLTFIAKLFSS